MAQAHEEAERIISLARTEAAELTAEHSLAKAAEERASAIRQQAERDAEGVRKGADGYAFDVLCQLEQEIKRALTVIENGIHTIQVERESRASELPVVEEVGDSSSGDGETP
jgi:hypothetical protein